MGGTAVPFPGDSFRVCPPSDINSSLIRNLKDLLNIVLPEAQNEIVNQASWLDVAGKGEDVFPSSQRRKARQEASFLENNKEKESSFAGIFSQGRIVLWERELFHWLHRKVSNVDYAYALFQQFRHRIIFFPNFLFVIQPGACAGKEVQSLSMSS